MNEYFPKFIDISSWNKKPYSSTGGTRAKNIYINLENDREYFFKGLKKLIDGSFKYPDEFWSEIISSKIGQWLGFNLLDYNIGYDINDEQQIGCLSESMVIHTDNKLSEGVEYLRGYDPTYIPSRDESRYTFNFIRETLQSFRLSDLEGDFIKMLIFDALIGNSDRHQENWGFIANFKETLDEINLQIKGNKGLFKKLGLRINRAIAKAAQELGSSEDIKNQKLNKNIFTNSKFYNNYIIFSHI